MARVLYITSTFPDYSKCGTGIYAGYLTRGLSQQGHEIHVLTTSHPDIKASLGKLTIHKTMSTWTFKDTPAFAKVMHMVNPQIVHINHPTALAAGKSQLFVNLIPSIIKSTWGTPIVTTLHEFLNNSTLGKLKVLPLVFGSNAVTVTNRRYKEDLSRFVPPGFSERIKVINIGSQFDESRPYGDPVQMRERWKIQSTDLVIGFVGFITPPKGFENLVASVIPLMREDPRIKVLALSSWNLSTPAYRHKIQSLIDESGFGERFIFSGYLKDEELWDSLSALDLVALPFNDPVEDRSSGPLRQVLFRGLPVLTFSKDQNYSEFGFEHGKNIWFSKHQDLRGLQTDIKMLLMDSSLRKRLSEGAIGLKSTLSFDHISNEFSRLYAQILEHR